MIEDVGILDNGGNPVFSFLCEDGFNDGFMSGSYRSDFRYLNNSDLILPEGMEAPGFVGFTENALSLRPGSIAYENSGVYNDLLSDYQRLGHKKGFEFLDDPYYHGYLSEYGTNRIGTYDEMLERNFTGDGVINPNNLKPGADVSNFVLMSNKLFPVEHDKLIPITEFNFNRTGGGAELKHVICQNIIAMDNIYRTLIPEEEKLTMDAVLVCFPADDPGFPSPHNEVYMGDYAKVYERKLRNKGITADILSEYVMRTYPFPGAHMRAYPIYAESYLKDVANELVRIGIGDIGLNYPSDNNDSPTWVFFYDCFFAEVCRFYKSAYNIFGVKWNY